MTQGNPIDPRSRTRNRQVVRVIQIIALMQTGYWSTAGLAKRLKISERTARRDLAAIYHGRVQLRHDGEYGAWTLAYGRQ